MVLPRDIQKEAIARLKKVKTEDELRVIELEYLGRKRGKLTALLRSLKKLSGKRRAEVGKAANHLRKELEVLVEKQKAKFAGEALSKALEKERIDITFPGARKPRGHIHPLTQIRREAESVFTSMGFVIAEGPEVETEYYNFDALNIPKDHPARDLWDTFWLKESKPARSVKSPLNAQRRKNRHLLRTHTSSVQIRYMERNQPPIRIISPGKVFRYEATDATHDTEFAQLECLYVDHDASVANLKYALLTFFQKLFSPKVAIRLRPSFFPFVEPGFEVDMKTPGGEWLEMLGAGMVHQEVFKKVGYVPGNWKGFAFGIGLDRIAMLKYKIPDIRLFRSGDARFLRQF